MKQLTLIIAMAICFGCYGQKKDSLITLGSGLSDTRIWATPANHTTSFTISRRDTVPCIMLVCDTTFINGYASQYEFSDSLVYINKSRLSFAWWQFGYEVRFTNQYGYMNWIEHLDADKKRLPPSLVVWMSKEIK